MLKCIRVILNLAKDDLSRNLSANIKIVLVIVRVIRLNSCLKIRFTARSFLTEFQMKH